jgi:hypothetical protein
MNRLTTWLTLDRLRQFLAGVFLVLFAVVWIWIAVKLLSFNPTPAQPKLVLSGAFVTISGVLTGTVAAATATALGINVVNAQQAGVTGGTLAKNALSPLVAAGVITYAGVGILLLIVWLATSDTSPEVVQAFGVGVVGWLGGAYVAVTQP